jgi:hypothetical protein
VRYPAVSWLFSRRVTPNGEQLPSHGLAVTPSLAQWVPKFARSQATSSAGRCHRTRGLWNIKDGNATRYQAMQSDTRRCAGTHPLLCKLCFLARLHFGCWFSSLFRWTFIPTFETGCCVTRLGQYDCASRNPSSIPGGQRHG